MSIRSLLFYFGLLISFSASVAVWAQDQEQSLVAKTSTIKPYTQYSFGGESLKLTNSYFSIPVVYNAQVEKWVNYFWKGAGRDHFIRFANRSGRYAAIMGDILERQGLPRDLIFLAMAESGFHGQAKSWARAVGPWQFMAETAAGVGLKINFYVDERVDFIKSTVAASVLLKQLFAQFSWELGMAAYNAGPGKIKNAQRIYGTDNFWEMIESRKNYLKQETKDYIPKIYALAIIGKNLDVFGFHEISFDRPMNFDVIEIPGGADLVLVGEALGISLDMIQEYNPELLRWLTPPYEKSYLLRLPVGLRDKWMDCCAKKDYKATLFKKYLVSHSESVKNVARKFHLPDEALLSLNGYSSGGFMLKKGDKVLLPIRTDQSSFDPMYKDLGEEVKRVAKKQNSMPRDFYRVQKGDTLWKISKETGVSMDILIRLNYRLVTSNQNLREGDRILLK